MDEKKHWLVCETLNLGDSLLNVAYYLYGNEQTNEKAGTVVSVLPPNQILLRAELNIESALYA